jgi:hypothetical protein
MTRKEQFRVSRYLIPSCKHEKERWREDDCTKESWIQQNPDR